MRAPVPQMGDLEGALGFSLVQTRLLWPSGSEPVDDRALSLSLLTLFEKLVGKLCRDLWFYCTTIMHLSIPFPTGFLKSPAMTPSLTLETLVPPPPSPAPSLCHPPRHRWLAQGPVWPLYQVCCPSDGVAGPHILLPESLEGWGSWPLLCPQRPARDPGPSTRSCSLNVY